MRKLLLSIALLATAASGHADIVLKASSIGFCPKEVTTSGKTIVYTIKEDKVTIYTSDFLVDRTFTLPSNPYIYGSYSETANVKVTGAKFRFDDYITDYGGSFTKTEITATTQKDLLEHLGSNYVAFTDPMGNPGCFNTVRDSWYPDNCYLRELFGAKYPRSWYAIIDGAVYSYAYTSNYNSGYPYDLVYDESTANWIRFNENERSEIYLGGPRFAIDGKKYRDNVTLTQSFFNDDNKWEFITYEYGPVETTINNVQIGNVREDGTVEVTRSISYRNKGIGMAIYNEDGEKLYTLGESGEEEVDAIHIINGKKYILYTTGKREGVALLDISDLGEDIDPTKKIEIKNENRLNTERGFIVVDINREQAGGEVIVSTIDGKVMANKKVEAGQTRINEYPLSTGMYVVSLIKDGKIIESEKYLVP